MSQLIICYNGSWKDCCYIGGISICVLLQSNANYTNLVDLIYTVTGIDRTRFDIKIHYLAPVGNSFMKSLIMDDNGVNFLTFDRGCKPIYIDTIVREFGGNRTDVRRFFPDSLPDLVQVQSDVQQRQLIRRLGRDETYFASGTGSNHVSVGVGVLTSSEDPLSKDYDNDWDNCNDGDESPVDMYGMSEEETPGDEDMCGMSEEEIAGDEADIEEIGRQDLPDINFSGLQFTQNPSERHWVVPGVNNCRIDEIATEVSTFYRPDSLYQGAVFRSKELMRRAIGVYALKLKFDYRVRRSCTIRFEVGCKDVNCKFKICARCRAGCTLWHIVKFLPNHTCVRDS